MATITITTRRTKSGPRYVVRFRLGGRAYPLVHAGSFKTRKEAKTRRDFVAGELAAGRNPADALRAVVDPPKRRTFREWAEAYKTSRVDLATLRAVLDFADVDPNPARDGRVKLPREERTVVDPPTGATSTRSSPWCPLAGGCR
jgi:hypothetical protein